MTPRLSAGSRLLSKLLESAIIGAATGFDPDVPGLSDSSSPPGPQPAAPSREPPEPFGEPCAELMELGESDVPRNLDALVALSERNDSNRFCDCQNLGRLLNPLRDLQAMVGIDGVKQQIFEMVLLLLQQGLPRPKLGHIIICGKPGIGKTTLANILARIFFCLGQTTSSKIVHATAANMIAGYLGQTANKTAELVEEAFGGVLLIDEVTSLSDGRTQSSGDSFSKSAIDQLNRMLTEHGHKFVCILAGYEDEIERDFLSVNPGLKRRFTTVFRMTDYSPAQLALIAKTKLSAAGFSDTASYTLDSSYFANPARFFPSMAGDVDVLLDKIMLAHGYSRFGRRSKRCLQQEAVDRGFQMFKDAQDIKYKRGNDRNCFDSMYI